MCARDLQRKSNQLPELRKLDRPRHNTYTNYVISLLQMRFREYHRRSQKRSARGGEATARPGRLLVVTAPLADDELCDEPIVATVTAVVMGSDSGGAEGAV